ncbi:MAG: glycosyltransferase family 2 protein [Planctomycetes bacterium]|nr:glycosyltransferase family 2 protein [Planctomycetota bacterium]
MPAPELSIVIVNWNTRELLLALLGQLFTSAAGAGVEVIVVDNDSADGSVAAAQQAFPRAIVLPQQKNGGFAYGVNRGIEAASGAWILLLNTDTEVTWPALDAFVATARRHPKAAICGPRIVNDDGSLQRSVWRRHLPRDYLPFVARFRAAAREILGAQPVDNVNGSVFLIRRTALQQLGALDERFFMYFEEADLCERARRAGMEVMYLPEQTFVHAGGLSSKGSAKLRTYLAFKESCLLYHAQWHGRAWTEFIRFWLWAGLWPRLFAALLLTAIGRGPKPGVFWAGLKLLSRPGLVGELCRRPRQVLAVGAGPSVPPPVTAMAPQRT